MHVWDFAPVFANADLLAQGLLNTLKVTGAALAFGVPLGLVLALMRLSRQRLARWPAGFVIEVFRTTPPLVQLFWFFFALPILIAGRDDALPGRGAHLLDPVGRLLRRSVPRRHRLDRARPVGAARAPSA